MSDNKMMSTIFNNNTKIDCTIGEFFAHKNVFITGGTGFLGTVLIEGLLSVSPDIGKIYVLVRGKYGCDPNTRIERMLAKPIFAAHSEKTLKKVIPVVGELFEPNFSFDPDILKELQENVNIIYHGAATINFNANLRIAIKTNIIGTLRTIQLAKSLNNLNAYIYLSTAFCNCNNLGLIEEKIYTTQYDPYEMIKLAESDDNFIPDKYDPKLKYILGTHPNTYTFTKQLSEKLISMEMGNYPTSIVRPSVVYNTYQFPVEGWVGNANSGHLGWLAGFMKGIFRTMSGDPNSVVDIIPCDYVINSSLVMAWYVGTRETSEISVIHCTSGEINPLKFRDLESIFNDSVKKYPSDRIVWLPHAKIRKDLRYKVCFYLFHLLPAYLLFVPERLFKLGKVQHSCLDYMRVFDKGTKAFEFFVQQEFRYSLKNSLRVMSCLNDKDIERYSFNANNCNWSLLMDRCFKGLRQFYFRESNETTIRHRIVWKFFEVLYYLGYLTLFGILVLIGHFFLPNLETAIAFATLLLTLIIWV